MTSLEECRPTQTADEVFEIGARGDECWMQDDRGGRRALPMERWFGSGDAAPQDRAVDEFILAHCGLGPTLDLGCGPGRFLGWLQASGRPSLGVDSSATAVRMTRSRGGAALHGDVFAPIPAEGHWDRVLLVDGNIGIGGDPTRLLLRISELLADDGVAVIEIDAIANDSRNEMVRWETRDHVGSWFPWSTVGRHDLEGLAAAAGMRVLEVADVHHRRVATLVRNESRGR